jgi:hypothetical protein
MTNCPNCKENMGNEPKVFKTTENDKGDKIKIAQYYCQKCNVRVTWITEYNTKLLEEFNIKM